MKKKNPKVQIIQKKLKGNIAMKKKQRNCRSKSKHMIITLAINTQSP